VGLASKADALPAAGAWAGNGNQINDVGVPFHTADAKQLNQAQPKKNSNDNRSAGAVGSFSIKNFGVVVWVPGWFAPFFCCMRRRPDFFVSFSSGAAEDFEFSAFLAKNQDDID
jgi:hypothetical protein